MKVEESFATLFRRARAQSEDPATGKPYTQARLGELLGLSDTLLSQWEKGVGVPSLATVNDIARFLPVTVLELLRSMGADVETGPAGLTQFDRDLLAAARPLNTPNLRRTALAVVRALRPLPEDSDSSDQQPRRRRPAV